MNIHYFQVRKGTNSTAHKLSMKSVRFNFTKRITAASAVFAIILVWQQEQITIVQDKPRGCQRL